MMNGSASCALRAFSLLALLLPLWWADVALAEDCDWASYTLNTQAEVDDLGASLGASGCDAISDALIIEGGSNITSLDALEGLTSVGSLTISSNDALTNIDGLLNLANIGEYLSIQDNGALTNVDGLRGLTSVGELLRIRNNRALGNLNGLYSLASIGGALLIQDNLSLANVDGLSSLVSIGSSLQIENNTALANIEGLASVTSVYSIRIDDNPSLINLDGLGGVTSIESDLNIENNVDLVNVNGLANLTSIGGVVYIADNDALTDVDGLEGLTQAGRNLSLVFNDALTNVDGLASLSSVGGFLQIYSNYGLTNLDGLTSLSTVGGLLSIEWNSSLTRCEGVAPLLGWPSGPPDDAITGEIRLEGNATGCDSVNQVIASVSGPTKPAINSVNTTGGSITLNFNLATSNDALFPVTGHEARCVGASADLAEAPASALLDNAPVTRALTVTGYDQMSDRSTIEVDVDITHSDPADLYMALTTPEGTELVLWNQRVNGAEDLVGTFPTSLSPEDSLSTITGQTMDGIWTLTVEDIEVGPIVREGVLNSWGLRVTEQLVVAGTNAPIALPGAVRGRTYTCTVEPLTKLNASRISDPVTVLVNFERPATPTITSTDYEDGKIILSVSVSDNGGTDITGYEANCTDGTSTYMGASTSSTITVSGLINDVAYTCTVTATNSVGPSSASAATAPITPEEIAAGLPVWLLYQATQ